MVHTPVPLSYVVPWLEIALTNSRPAGSVSVRRTPVASEGPKLVTATVYRTVAPKTGVGVIHHLRDRQIGPFDHHGPDGTGRVVGRVAVGRARHGHDVGDRRADRHRRVHPHRQVEAGQARGQAGDGIGHGARAAHRRGRDHPPGRRTGRLEGGAGRQRVGDRDRERRVGARVVHGEPIGEGLPLRRAGRPVLEDGEILGRHHRGVDRRRGRATPDPQGSRPWPCC